MKITKIKLRVNEHYGDEERSFDLPEGWTIDVVKMNNHDAPSLNKKQIDDALDHPIGTKTITELAKGKRGPIVIVHDDLTRPTPAYQIVPSILDQLHEANIGDDQIFFMAAFGSHPPMTVDAIGRKIGYDIIQKYPIRNHVVFDTRHFGTYNFVDKGFTSFGTPVIVNRAYAQSDLRIAITGMIKKGLGCGGGGKICMPGIASLEAIAYNHTVVGRMISRESGYWKIKRNVMRHDMQEFARKSPLDFCINVVPNGAREAAGVFAGDVDDAWIEGVKACYAAHSTPIPNKKYDVIIACGYPQAASEGLRWCEGANDILKPGGTAVNISLSISPAYYLTHYLDEAVRAALLRFMKKDRNDRWPIEHADNIIVYDKLYALNGNRGKLMYNERVEWVTDWSLIVQRLIEVHGKNASVAVFPTTALQFNPAMFPLEI